MSKFVFEITTGDIFESQYWETHMQASVILILVQLKSWHDSN